jgi:hypothetical protein
LHSTLIAEFHGVWKKNLHGLKPLAIKAQRRRHVSIDMAAVFVKIQDDGCAAMTWTLARGSDTLQDIKNVVWCRQIDVESKAEAVRPQEM